MGGSSTTLLYAGAALAGGFDALAYFLDGRGDNRGAVCGMMKFQVHTAADEAQLEHGTAPGRTGYRDLNWFGAVLRMSGDERRALAQK